MHEKPNFTPPDWEKLPWEETPYKGVFLHKIKEEPDQLNPNTPFLTVMALKMEPQAVIPLHKHNRKTGWTETINLPNEGHIEIKDSRGTNEITVAHSLTMRIKEGEIFGLKNMDIKPLYFFSTMKPGFTGYGEIEEIKEAKDADSPVLTP